MWPPGQQAAISSDQQGAEAVTKVSDSRQNPTEAALAIDHSLPWPNGQFLVSFTGYPDTET